MVIITKRRAVIIQCFIFSLVFLCSIATAYATETEGTCTLILKADIPDSFTDNITVYFRISGSDEVEHQFVLTAPAYSGEFDILSGVNYETEIILNSRYEAEGLEAEYQTGRKLDCNFKVKEAGLIEDRNTSQKAESPHGEEKDDYFENPKAVLDNYYDNIKYLDDVKDYSGYDRFFSVYGGKTFEQYFLAADPMNTLERWEKLDNVERFTYYILFYYPQICVVGENPATTKMEFMSNLDNTKRLIGKIENESEEERGERLYKAVEEVWQWHWSYWEYTGTFYNFFDRTEENLADFYAEDAEQETAKKDSRNDKEKELESMKLKNTIIDIIGNNLFSILLVLLSGAACLFVWKKKTDIKADGETDGKEQSKKNGK